MNDRPCPRCGHYMNPNTLPKNCLMPGSVLKNRYVVGNPIGVGGFGITYKCLDTQIGGVCAIKEYLPSSIAGRTRPNKNVVVQDGSIENFNRMMKSFANEANLLKTLQHKNVISCYDSFFENNTAYFVMEYCDGINLRKYVNNFARKLEYNEGINILNQLMDGLEYIHSLNVLHRDLKPENIYITSKNVVKILDFGSARNELDQYMKELSKVVTVGYAPIEQYGGRGVQGHYTDIYALGATFYHLFTGKMPEESVQRVSDDRLVPLSALRPDLPVELKYAIEKCMVVSKTQRIQNISDLRQILKSSQPHQPPSPPPPPPPPPPPVPPVPPVPPPPVHTKKIVGYASLGQRVCANLIDGGIFGFIYLPFFIICTALGDVGGLLISLVFYPGYSFLVSSLMELWFGRTFGKMMLGQVVLDRSGKKAPAGHIFLRNLIKMIGVFLLCFAREGKLLHDFSTNSVVYIKK